MAHTIKRVEYFYTTVKDKPGEAYRLLATLKDLGINQVAFAAVPVGPNSTQLTIFPDDSAKLKHEAQQASMDVNGPQHAFLVQGDDEIGALIDIHKKIHDANINVYGTTGVTDGRGSFGYLIYVKEADFERAADCLGI